MNSGMITHIIGTYFSNAPFDLKGRHYGAHALRHSLATHLINESVPPFTVANVLGHSSTECIHIYAKVDFFHQMEALYHKFYKNQMTATEYFNFILKPISDKDFVSSDLFKKYLKLYPNDSGPLLFFNYLYGEHKELFSDWKCYLAKIKDI